MALLRLSLILLLVCMAHADTENASDVAAAGWGMPQDCVDGECFDEEAMATSPQAEIGRRVLRGAGRHVSYDALRRDAVPCGQRGQSYYNCQGSSQVNPYHRGCSAITRCARDLH